ncbi:MAG: hypothetical protein B7O98_07875 [Zestosphaera tikiterensis]|uniref:Thioredoxin domain-containing protein n=1 Tax=Zestosphaera tikiterensis TaxID=1973259 RepID=A0A2R7Y4T5_9CREN|nr:MAG: hypothetical protein B7O98_07875 [Zestosphaera tikiterensis]
MLKKAFGLVLTLLFTMALLTTHVVIPQTLDGLRLITFGSQSCPHCRALHDFFSKNYVGMYTFFWVEDKVGSELFAYLAGVEVSYGLSTNYAYAVPQTLVLSEGRAVAIVIGEVTNVDFWNGLLNLKPNTSIPIYLGNNRLVSIPQEGLTQLITNINYTLKTSAITSTPATTQATTSSNANASGANLTGVAVVAAGVVLAVAYFIVKRRKP